MTLVNRLGRVQYIISFNWNRRKRRGFQPIGEALAFTVSRARCPTPWFSRNEGYERAIRALDRVKSSLYRLSKRKKSNSKYITVKVNKNNRKLSKEKKSLFTNESLAFYSLMLQLNETRIRSAARYFTAYFPVPNSLFSRCYRYICNFLTSLLISSCEITLLFNAL